MSLYYFPLMLGSLRGFVDTAASSIPPEANKESNHRVLEDSEAMVDISSQSCIAILVQQKKKEKKRKLKEFLMSFLYTLSFIVKVYSMGFLYISMNEQCMRLIDSSLLPLISFLLLFCFLRCWHLHMYTLLIMWIRTHTHMQICVHALPCVSQSVTPQHISKSWVYIIIWSASEAAAHVWDENSQSTFIPHLQMMPLLSDRCYWKH